MFFYIVKISFNPKYNDIIAVSFVKINKDYSIIINTISYKDY